MCAQQRLKSRAPLHERLLTEIASVQFKKIEAIDARRRMSPVEQRKKVGLAVTACSDQFTIDDARSCREPQDRRGDPWEAACEIAAIAAENARAGAGFMQLHSIAVEFEHELPALASGR